MKVAVGVFVKTPGHSPIKTRLAADAGEAAAGEFYELATVVMRELLLELQAPGDGFEFRPFWAVAETGGMGDARWAELPRVEQGEGPLADRLHRVHERLRAEGDAVLLLGADCLELARAEIVEAARVLRDGAHAVLGPARDGGFWLFGARVPLPADFWRAIPYSSPETAVRVRAELATRGLRIGPELAVRGDVDVIGDLEALRSDLAARPELGRAQSFLAGWLGRQLRGRLKE